MKKTSDGLTLAELLIVAAILAVLLGAALPVFHERLELTRDYVDAANLRQAYAEAVLYLIDHPGVRDGNQVLSETSYRIQSSDNTWSGNSNPCKALGFVDNPVGWRSRRGDVGKIAFRVKVVSTDDVRFSDFCWPAVNPVQGGEYVRPL